MESLIIVFIMAIGSIVIKSLSEQGKKQAAGTSPDRKNIKQQPAAYRQSSTTMGSGNRSSTVVKPGGRQQVKLNEGNAKQIKAQPVQQPHISSVEEGSGLGSMRFNSMEGTQQEGFFSDLDAGNVDIVYNDQDEQYSLIEAVTGDMQRSVLAAEILGRPRAFKRSIR
ncbi:MAG: hypothetical protein ACOZCL_09185 [Bacillota bacterium]